MRFLIVFFSALLCMAIGASAKSIIDVAVLKSENVNLVKTIIEIKDSIVEIEKDIKEIHKNTKP